MIYCLSIFKEKLSFLNYCWFLEQNSNIGSGEQQSHIKVNQCKNKEKEYNKLGGGENPKKEHNKTPLKLLEDNIIDV